MGADIWTISFITDGSVIRHGLSSDLSSAGGLVINAPPSCPLPLRPIGGLCGSPPQYKSLWECAGPPEQSSQPGLARRDSKEHIYTFCSGTFSTTSVIRRRVPAAGAPSHQALLWKQVSRLPRRAMPCRTTPHHTTPLGAAAIRAFWQARGV